MPSPWLAQDNPPEVTPIDDLREHVVGINCWCHPFMDQEVLVHNALDGREKYERRNLRAWRELPITFGDVVTAIQEGTNKPSQTLDPTLMVNALIRLAAVKTAKNATD